MTTNENKPSTSDERVETPSKPTETIPDSPADRKREASWPAVLFYIHLNILGLYGIMVLFTNTSITTVLFSECPTRFQSE